MTYDKSMLLKRAHIDWKIVRERPGWSWGRTLKLAHAVERKRAAGPERYQPPPAEDWTYVEPPPSILFDAADVFHRASRL
jgi:hypothetical protein